MAIVLRIAYFARLSSDVIRENIISVRYMI